MTRPLALALFATLVGCGGGELEVSSRVPATPVVPVVETPLSLCTHAWETLCPAYRQCLPTVFATDFIDLADCVAKNADQCVRLKWADGSADTIAGETRCLRELPAAATCRDVIEGLFDHTALLADCVPPPGARPDGAPCGYYVQCAGGACHFPPGALCGTCGAPAAEGGGCATTFDCAGGASCVVGACVTPGRTGEACSPTAPCDLESTCAKGTCAARGAAGSACAIDAPFTACEGDLYCDTTHATCAEAKLAPAIGDVCGTIDGGLVLCAAGAFCAFVGASGACVGTAKEGATCDAAAPAFGAICEHGTACVGGACVRIDPAVCGLERVACAPRDESDESRGSDRKKR